MRKLQIDEYLVVNTYTGKKKWLQSLPKRLGAYETAIHIKGTVLLPDKLPTVDFGEITIPEFEAQANAEMM